MIEIKKVSYNNKDFLRFPWRIYESDPYWVPPLFAVQKKLLDIKKNPFYKNAKLQLFLAYKNSKCVGRIAAILNRNHNQYTGEKAVFFGFFECTHDPKVNQSLLDAVSTWGAEHQMTLLKGPVSPSINDDSGLLIEGFQSSPYIMMSYNPSYYVNLLEGYGLRKSKDLLAYFLDGKDSETPALIHISETARKEYNITIRNVNLKKAAQEEVDLAYQVYNDAWSRNWGFVPMTREEMEDKLKELKEIAIPDFTFVMEANHKPIGFCLALPNLNEILKPLNGRLFPFGWLKLMRDFKKISSIRVFALGVLQEYQKTGLGAVGYHELIKRGRKLNMMKGELSWVLEDNHQLNKSLIHLGAKVYKKYRIYEKAI